MGLDMYLNAKRFISLYSEDTKKVKITGLKGALPPKDGCFNEMGRLRYVEVNGIYWRKANAIHKWFVDNCQKGEDNCESHLVSREDLEKLRDLCKEVMSNKDKAAELLPFQEGFFFGTYDYDEWYWGSVKGTIEEIDELLNYFDEDWEFYYESSW